MAGETADNNIMEVEVGHQHSSGSSDVEVRWMASGQTAWRSEPNAQGIDTVAAVKAELEAAVGVPVSQQHLFSGRCELLGDEVVPTRSVDNAALLLVRSISDPSVTDLGHFHNHASPRALEVGAFTQVRKLSDAIYGSVWECTWRRKGTEGGVEAVAVKQVRRAEVSRLRRAKTDERSLHLKRDKSRPAEDALAEIGIMSFLAQQADLPQYLLRMLGVFEDSQHIWFVTELADGGELFKTLESKKSFPETDVQRFTWQLLQAVAYLHTHGIGHRDISLENLLLHQGSIRLMDFGMAVSLKSSSGQCLRYYREIGKRFYRAPECYVPEATHVQIAAPLDVVPGAVVMAKTSTGNLCQVRLPESVAAGRFCRAEVWGYTVAPIDVFACFVCVFILRWGNPPWTHAILGGSRKDSAFEYVHSRGDAGMEALLSYWRKPLLSDHGMDLLAMALRSEPSQRPSPCDCLAHPWLADHAGDPVLTHSGMTGRTM